MAGGVLGAAGFLQPCQGEQQALSGMGCRMGRRTRVLPSALLPASAQEDVAESVERDQRPPRGRGKQPQPGSGLCCFPEMRRREPRSRRGSGRTRDPAGVLQRGHGEGLK